MSHSVVRVGVTYAVTLSAALALLWMVETLSLREGLIVLALAGFAYMLHGFWLLCKGWKMSQASLRQSVTPNTTSETSDGVVMEKGRTLWTAPEFAGNTATPLLFRDQDGTLLLMSAQSATDARITGTRASFN